MEVTYDGQITIATGKKRTETKWKNTEMPWSEFLGIIGQTTRTRETYAEYAKLPRADQDSVKDVGGFVGGTLSGGHRRKGSVANRSILTLDADHNPVDLIPTLDLLFGCSWAVYSTHKHSPDSPRYRLIMPLSRKVSADEYAAIGRRVAADIGIDYFDDTTYEPERLMYWPSTSSDGEFIFQYSDGPWLDVGATLKRYADWHDASQWPLSSRVSEVHKSKAEKQGDPLAKDGVIGAFCRAYTIEDAISTFLSDKYLPCEGERYTYSEGSTVGGLVVYDDKFAFSHHGTDPAGGKLCNAFDLVRLHKFGEQDDEVKAGTPSNRIPSFKQMTQFALSDDKVKLVLGEEQLAKAREEFGETEDAEVDKAWLGLLQRNDRGQLSQTINNAVLVLDNSPSLKGKIAFNKFSGRLMIRKDLPWKYLEDKESQMWSDTDDANLRLYLEKVYGLGRKNQISDAVSIIAERNSFHPVRDYLDGLSWDGTERVETLLIDYLGAEDMEYVRAVTRKTMAAGVARVRHPGVKFDTMLTLHGAQGLGKSTLIRLLAKEWFSDSLTSVTGKEAYEQLAGYWLVEMGEMTAMKKAEVEATKHFLSKVEDVYRPAYGRYTKGFPRQCVFWGSTNKPDFLRDETGGRRFWVVDVGVTELKKNVFKDLTGDEVDQIWAEAQVIWLSGEQLDLPKHLEAEAALIQQSHTEDNPKIGMVRAYLDTPIPNNWDTMDLWTKQAYLEEPQEQGRTIWPRSRVCAIEIWAELFGGDARSINRMQVNEIHDIMAQMDGWERAKGKLKFGVYGSQKGYLRKN